MIIRRNKAKYFPAEAKEDLYNLCKILNRKYFRNSSHYEYRLDDRNISREQVNKFLDNLILKQEDIFEYQKEGYEFIRVNFRLSFDDKNDIIFVLDGEKKIRTVWINSKNDHHATLNFNLYHGAEVRELAGVI
jgi:hypothetical protein